MEHYDVIVVGVGSMGAAACYHLARRNVRVLGLEQFGIPHNLGSHHGQSRMIRLAYFEHPDYVPLLLRAYEQWRDLEEASGHQLLHPTGGLYMGPAGSTTVGGAVESCRQHALSHELLAADEIVARWPGFRLPEGYQGLLESAAGVLLPELAVSTHARLALTHGATLHGHEPVRTWHAERDAIVVRTDRQTYRAARLVLAGGAWSAQLAGQLGVDLRVTRQVLAWFAPGDSRLFQLGALPVWYLEAKSGDGYYGFPMLPGTLGIKVACHAAGRTVTPAASGSLAPGVDAADIAPLEQFFSNYLPAAQGPLLSACTCYYTHSPDEHFILDHHPADPRVTLACGFSGHGFKFCSVIGMALADLALDGSSPLPVGFLRLQRFANQRFANQTSTNQ